MRRPSLLQVFEFRQRDRDAGLASPFSLLSYASLMVSRGSKTPIDAPRIGNHTFRATGITAHLKNGGTLEKAAMIANHASTRTTQLYDHRNDEVSLDEVERILI